MLSLYKQEKTETPTAVIIKLLTPFQMKATGILQRVDFEKEKKSKV